MKKYIVSIETKEVIPMVIEADNEWDAMVRVSDGEGFLHESGSHISVAECTGWCVQEYSDSIAHELYQEWL